MADFHEAPFFVMLQPLASTTDQEMSGETPVWTRSGLALMETSGLITFTVAVLELTEPPAPMQVI